MREANMPMSELSLTRHQHIPSRSSLFHLLQSCHSSQWCWDDQALPTHVPTVSHRSNCSQNILLQGVTTSCWKIIVQATII